MIQPGDVRRVADIRYRKFFSGEPGIFRERRLHVAEQFVEAFDRLGEVTRVHAFG